MIAASVSVVFSIGISTSRRMLPANADGAHMVYNSLRVVVFDCSYRYVCINHARSIYLTPLGCFRISNIVPAPRIAFHGVTRRNAKHRNV